MRTATISFEQVCAIRDRVATKIEARWPDIQPGICVAYEIEQAVRHILDVDWFGLKPKPGGGE